MATQNKPTPIPVPVPAGFKLGPGAKGVIPGAGSKPATLADPAPKSILDVPNPETGYVPDHVAKAKAKKAKAPTVPAPPSFAEIEKHGADVLSETPGVHLLGKAGTTFVVQVPADLLAKIQKPVTGMGGWQRVMLELQAATGLDAGQDGADPVPVPVVTLTPFQLDRLITLAVKHGSGGYQAVIRHLVCLTLAQHKGAILGGKQ